MTDTRQTASRPAMFAPVADAARLYPGKVMHARLKPFGHRFTYRVFSLLIDPDRLDEANNLSRLFSVNRPNLVSFREVDHIDSKSGATSVRSYVDGLLEAAGLPRPSSIRLLCYPRIFGFVFNPLSVYFCHGADGELATVIYEVRNTFGERHSYVCPVESGQLGPAGLRQHRTKIFYVSPFIDLGAQYHFRVLPPGDGVRLRILETEAGEPLLSATFSGEAVPLATPKLLSLLVRIPFMTAKVVAAIHWQALKLWAKGARFHVRGAPPAPVSLAPPQNTLEPAE